MSRYADLYPVTRADLRKYLAEARNGQPRPCLRTLAGHEIMFDTEADRHAFAMMLATGGYAYDQRGWPPGLLSAFRGTGRSYYFRPVTESR